MRPERNLTDAVVGPPSSRDWTAFCAWAQAEGWRVPASELAIYRRELAGSAFVLRDSDEVPLGMVTVCHQPGGAWIGNLIVDPQRRGAGFGRRLFEHAVDFLSAAGVGSLWLTASPQGRAIYERAGFREAGRIERWVWSGVGTNGEILDIGRPGDLPGLLKADAAAWGYSRAGLLTLLARGGRIVASGSSVAMLQPADGVSVIGPWLSADLCPRSNRTVLAGILDSFAGAGEIAVDLVGGSPVCLLLQAAGFSRVGETVLMVRGAPGPVRFAEIMSLASLGSMG